MSTGKPSNGANKYSAHPPHCPCEKVNFYPSLSHSIVVVAAAFFFFFFSVWNIFYHSLSALCEFIHLFLTSPPSLLFPIFVFSVIVARDGVVKDVFALALHNEGVNVTRAVYCYRQCHAYMESNGCIICCQSRLTTVPVTILQRKMLHYCSFANVCVVRLWILPQGKNHYIFVTFRRRRGVYVFVCVCVV